MSKVLIIGATSGIGLGLTQEYLNNKHQVMAVGRQLQALESLQRQYPQQLQIASFDLLRDDAFVALKDWTSKQGPFDICVLNSGVATDTAMTDWSQARITIDTNVTGQAQWVFAILQSVRQTKHATTIALNSSIAGLRGLRQVPLYSASKAFQINMLESLRGLAVHEKLPLKVVDIRPGFVDTKMAGGDFWMSSVEKAARQIYQGVHQQKRVIYVSRRWGLVAAILKLVPNWLHEKI